MSAEAARRPDREEIERLAGRLEEVLRWLAANADPAVTDAVAELLDGLQRVHGEGLRRLAGLLVEDEERWGRALADPVVSSLFELYELRVGRPDGGSPTGDVSVVPEDRLVQLERRLRRERPGAAGKERPERVAEIPLDELPEGSLFAALVDDTPVLVVRSGEGVRAYRNACPGSPLPLHVGTLDGATLVCPWHGCRFDVRSGERESGTGPPLDRLPSRIGHGLVRVLVP